MARPELSVIVPSWGAPRTMPALLDALALQSIEPDRHEIVVVDAGADGGMRLLERLTDRWTAPPRLRVLRGPLPGGPAARRNHGAREALGRVLAFTDSDCRPEAGWLEAGLSAVDGGAEVVQGATLPPDGAAIEPFSHSISIARETGLYETCNMFYERRAFERAGGFSTRYFRRFMSPFGEDVALGWTARRQGARFRFEPGAVVRHPVEPQSVAAHLRYQWRARGFPLLVREFPELREAFLHRRWFLSPRSARASAAVVGLSLAARKPAAAALALPYASALHRDGAPAGRQVVSDAALAAALLWGSVRWRRLVI